MLLEIIDLVAHHGPGQVLYGIGLEVAAGECLAVLGRNGMGKTTLVHTVAGLHPATAGRIVQDGVDVTDVTAEQRSRTGMALVPQGHRVFGSLTVAENLAVAARPGPHDLASVMTRFPILQERADQRAGDLSGGQQQILVVARALVANPRLVLMDEPSEGLDPRRVAMVTRMVEDLVGAGSGVLLVEQRLGFALRVATRVAVMERGSLTLVEDADAARSDPATLHDLLGLA